MYFNGLHQSHNGKRTKPFYEMVKVRNLFLTMCEMPKSQYNNLFYTGRIGLHKEEALVSPPKKSKKLW